jgi:hypothetical protein
MITLTPTGIDDTAQLQAALAAHRIVRLGEGDFLATGDLVISHQRGKLVSDDGATLTFTTPDRPGITLAGWLDEVEVGGFNIGRSVPAVAGADGFRCAGVSCNNVLLHDIKVRNQHIGMNLGVTAWSHVEHIVIEECVSDGLRLTNGMPSGTLQWQLDDVLSQKNGGRGFFVFTQPGSVQCTMGNWSKVSTWANSGCGAAFVGSATVPLHGVRVHDAFFGSDGNHECMFDTFGGHHELTKIFCELAGRGLTGPTLSTPVSGVGHGLYYSANNTGLTIIGGRATGNSGRGLHADASDPLLCVGMTAQGNLGGSYYLGSANQMLRECRNNAGALVNVAGPVIVA